MQVGAEFLAQHYPVRTVLLPNPTWANHNKIFPLAGIKDVRKYRYFKPSTKGLDYEVCPASRPEINKGGCQAMEASCISFLTNPLAKQRDPC